MLNVKLIKVKVRFYGLIKEIYLNLNYIESISPDYEDFTCEHVTIIRTVSGEKICVLMDYDDFVDYLVELSGLQKGGESE